MAVCIGYKTFVSRPLATTPPRRVLGTSHPPAANGGKSTNGRISVPPENVWRYETVGQSGEGDFETLNHSGRCDMSGLVSRKTVDC